MNDVMEEVMYLIALGMVPNIGTVQSKVLLEQLKTAKKIFHTPLSLLEKIPGIGPVRASSIHTFRDFRTAEKECEFVHRSGIRPLLITRPDYPQRLKHCQDPPTLLFYKGNADLNGPKVLGIVGTRRETDLGRDLIDAYIDAWRGMGLVIVSGLAYGVDQHAHRACLRNDIQTVGVLAHGLDKIYPQAHLGLARQMVNNGGLLTEFLSGTQPDKQNFPKRNRIVAGICDAVLVVETDVKGGSMITAELAAGYSREVFAIPGRIHDVKSQGCNYLIRENKARLTMHPSDLLEFMNWDTEPETAKPEQLFPALDPDQQILVDLVKTQGMMHIDQLQALSGLPHSRFSSALLFLELEKILLQVPGKQFKLNQVAGGQNLLRI